jgi:hypothetical protein
MSKFFIRSVALILVPCLLMDPVFTSAMGNEQRAMKRSLMAYSHGSSLMARDCFDSQALAPVAAAFAEGGDPLSKAPAELAAQTAILADHPKPAAPVVATDREVLNDIDNLLQGDEAARQRLEQRGYRIFSVGPPGMDLQSGSFSGIGINGRHTVLSFFMNAGFDQDHDIDLNYPGFGGLMLEPQALEFAIAEVAVNMQKYAYPDWSGVIVLRMVEEKGVPGVEVMARDHGIGIGDIPEAMREGHSPPELGRGLGLPIFRDAFTADGRGWVQIESPGTARIYREPRSEGERVASNVKFGTFITAKRWLSAGTSETEASPGLVGDPGEDAPPHAGPAIFISQIQSDDHAQVLRELEAMEAAATANLKSLASLPDLDDYRFHTLVVWRKTIELLKSAELLTTFVAKIGSRIIGIRVLMNSIELAELRVGSAIWGTEVVESQFQRRGIGIRLKLAAFQYLMARNYDTYVVFISEDNLRSERSLRLACEILGLNIQTTVHRMGTSHIVDLRSSIARAA